MDSFKIDSITDMTDGMNLISACIDGIRNGSGGGEQGGVPEEYIESVMERLGDNHPGEYKRCGRGSIQVSRSRG